MILKWNLQNFVQELPLYPLFFFRWKTHCRFLFFFFIRYISYVLNFPQLAIISKRSFFFKKKNYLKMMVI